MPDPCNKFAKEQCTGNCSYLDGICFTANSLCMGMGSKVSCATPSEQRSVLLNNKYGLKSVMVPHGAVDFALDPSSGWIGNVGSNEGVTSCRRDADCANFNKDGAECSIIHIPGVSCAPLGVLTDHRFQCGTYLKGVGSYSECIPDSPHDKVSLPRPAPKCPKGETPARCAVNGVCPDSTVKTCTDGFCCTGGAPPGPSSAFKAACEELGGTVEQNPNECDPKLYFSVKDHTADDTQYCCKRPPQKPHSPHSSPDVKPHSSSCAKPHSSACVKPHPDPDPQPHSSSCVKPHSSACVKPEPFDPDEFRTRCRLVNGTTSDCHAADACPGNPSGACDHGLCCAPAKLGPHPNPPSQPPDCPPGEVAQVCTDGSPGCVDFYRCAATGPPASRSATSPDHGGSLTFVALCIAAAALGAAVPFVWDWARRRLRGGVKRRSVHPR